MKRILAFLLLILPLCSHAQAGAATVAYYVHVAPPPGGMDTSTQRFVAQLASVGYTTSATEDTALDHLVNNLKGKAKGAYTAYDVWTTGTVKVCYPVVGNTASSQAINLMSPLYIVTWGGTFTRTSGYFQGDAATGTGNTNFNPNGKLSTAQGTIFEYIKTLGTGGDGTHDKIDILASDGIFADALIVQNNAGSGSYYGQITDGFDYPYYSSMPTAGYWAVAATSSTSLDMYQNGVKIGTTYTGGRGTSHPNYNIYLAAGNFAGSISNYSDNKIGFIIIGDGMNATYNAFLYNVANQFVTEIGK